MSLSVVNVSYSMKKALNEYSIEEYVICISEKHDILKRNGGISGLCYSAISPPVSSRPPVEKLFYD